MFVAPLCGFTVVDESYARFSSATGVPFDRPLIAGVDGLDGVGKLRGSAAWLAIRPARAGLRPDQAEPPTHNPWVITSQWPAAGRSDARSVAR